MKQYELDAVKEAHAILLDAYLRDDVPGDLAPKLAYACGRLEPLVVFREEPKATPIVPGPAKDDGKDRISAYDTTWPDMHKEPKA